MFRRWRKFGSKNTTALDEVFGKMKSEGGATCAIYVSNLHAMNDNLIAEALALGFGVDIIVHAMFASVETRAWLHNFLLEKLQVGEEMVGKILDVLRDGTGVERHRFTDSGLAFGDDHFRVFLSTHCEAFDLSDYIKVPWLCVEEDQMEVYKHLNGVYQIRGSTINCALAPKEDGVTYYLHKSCSDLAADNANNFHKLGRGCHRAQAAVDKLAGLGCEAVLAWRLVAFVQPPTNVLIDDFFIKVVQAFKIVSNFRTQLKMAIEGQSTAKRLLGSKRDFSDENAAASFVIDSSLYTSAQRNCSFDNQVALEPFTVAFLDLCAWTFHLDLTGKLVQRARISDVNRNKRKESLPNFDGPALAVLGVHSRGKEVPNFLFPSCSLQQYCYQDDRDTKGLYTPFSRLILVTTTAGSEFPYQMQHLQNSNKCLQNWVALRAAFEFDVESETFHYNTPDFHLANDLVKDGVAEFIKNTTPRFIRMFEMSPTTVSVTYFRSLSEKVAKICGASSPWLVRELISMFISLGADITGPEEYVRYGMMELTMKQIKINPLLQPKVLDFDEKVSIEGVLCRTNKNGKVCLHEHRTRKEGFQVVLCEGRIDVVDEDFCDVFPHPEKVVGNVWV